MKKTILLFLTLASATFTSCNEQTIQTYNNTIVLAHEQLLYSNDNFYKEASSCIGNPESKSLLINLIKETKAKINEEKKPVEALVPFTDHGLRRTILEMYDSTEDAMDLYAVKVDLITKKDGYEKTAQLFHEHISKFRELDQLIKELQVQYAYYNKLKLR